MIHVAGRGWRGGTLKLTPTANGLHVRVDDDHNPELWFELHIGLAEVLSMGAVANTLRDEPHLTAAPLGFVWGESPRRGTLNTSAPLGPQSPPDPDEEFDTWWRVLEDLGKCDGFGGMQYQRIREQWLNADPRPPVGAYIQNEANCGPEGKKV